MANRYWVGGTAIWDGTAGTKWALTSGGAGGQAAPTAADDVFFDAASGTVTCTVGTSGTVAKSINFTGFTGTFTGLSTRTITVSGSITIVAGMTYTFAGSYIINATGTLTSGGKTLGNIFISIGTITLGDNLTTNGYVSVGSGTFTTSASNYNITATDLRSTGTSARTINLNGSTVTLSTTAVPVVDFVSTGLTFNAGTSQINITGSNATFNGAGRTFYNVSFTSNTTGLKTITGANSFNNLTFDDLNSNAVSEIVLSANQTITGTLTINAGNTAPTRRFLIESDTVGTARTITAAAIDIFAADFTGITGAGAASWNDSSRTKYWGDCKGNSGITFATGRTVYWNLAGAQNWTAIGWSDTSGGTPDAQYFPLAQDTAVFDDTGSVTGTITLSASYALGGINMSARTSAMTLDTGTRTPTIYGNWTNGSGTTLSGTGVLTFAGRTTQTITSANKTFTQPITIDSLSGTVQLLDDLTIDSARTLTLSRGTFNANNYNVTAGAFSSNNSNTRTITMGSGLWTLSGNTASWDLATTTGLTFNKNTADILFSNTGTGARSFAGGGLTYNKLTIGGGSTATNVVTVSGVNTFSELASTRTVAYSIIFTNNQTINTWSVAGSAGNLVTVRSDTLGTVRTLTITNRTSGIDYLSIEDITAPTAPVTFYVGQNSNISRDCLGTAAITPVAGEFIYVLTSGTTWNVPADWDSQNNEIHLFGGGGGGAAGSGSSGSGRGGQGGGGGGYTKLTNVQLTRGSTVSYTIGAAGVFGTISVAATAGGTTTFFNTGIAAPGGSPGVRGTGGTRAAGGIGLTSTGGAGGLGFLASGSTAGRGSGGGGGAGGPLGTGGRGGDGSGLTTSASSGFGGGGGGNGGGSNGGNATTTASGTGGNNANGVGGGSSGNPGFNGGGGGGGISSQSLYRGGTGVDIAKAGLGGGGGAGGVGSSSNNKAPTGGLFGGAGSGGVAPGTSSLSGGDGGQGGIIIVYSSLVTPPTVTTGDFFFLIG